ncbi:MULTISPECIES: hypothetical protein [unclassified Paenibacillus]|uniref:hypothetical protein n=1 Tax=unclassified Paenibacillus TaxID=185978 RepID=UPI0009A8A6BA|nr:MULTISPECIES: hypothetical protein [unclassified Paenibacillus]SLK07561.1 hypothetical protein SAMN06272722_1059 [Paenibacillus sp. RU5A]SOC70767.1 hypothetical protein SAMN05880581_1059 [Paenibacillus sp. RU26A]SOC73100.1 hypothetical protein SAMN05880586_1059 [Paenibacillus sp. RU5M]
MKFYGIKQEKLLERIRYEKAKIKTFIRPYFEVNKEKREGKKEWYNRVFKMPDRFTTDRDNSIPIGKYFNSISVITVEIIAKEDVARLKEGIKRLILKNTSHKFIGGRNSLREMNESIDNLLDENIFSNNAWLECGRFDFAHNKT